MWYNQSPSKAGTYGWQSVSSGNKTFKTGFYFLRKHVTHDYSLFTQNTISRLKHYFEPVTVHCEVCETALVSVWIKENVFFFRKEGQVGMSGGYVRKVGQLVATKRKQLQDNWTRFSTKITYVNNCVWHCTLTIVEEVMSEQSVTQYQR